MKICFWGNVASAIAGNTPGGGELQIALLAKALSLGGHDVCILDYTIQDGFVTSEGVKVIPVQDWNKGIRILRTLTHRLPGLYKSLVAQKADIYYCRIREFRHIIAYWAARKVRARFVLGLAHDLEVLSFFKRCKYDYFTNIGDFWWISNLLLSEITFPWLLQKSDHVFVQHSGQEEILLKKGIKSLIFPNLIDLNEIPGDRPPAKEDFAFVGSLAKSKGIIELFQLISRTPEYTYKIIGQPRDKTGRQYLDKLESLSNVKVMGRLNHSDTLMQIKKSEALISTSPFEGFPNIFIEAWACETPVLSLYVNPGNVFKHKEMGFCSNGDIHNLINQMKQIKYCHKLASSARLYSELTFGLNGKRISEIDQIFRNL